MFGASLVLLCTPIFGISIPIWLGYALVLSFVGGFLYLVFRTPRFPVPPLDNARRCRR